jgi:hypothetical protein
MKGIFKRMSAGLIGGAGKKAREQKKPPTRERYLVGAKAASDPTAAELAADDGLKPSI